MHAGGFSIGCCAVLLAACTTTRLTVSGAPVRGDVRTLSPADIEAAVAAMRADLPEIRSQGLTHIDIINRNEVFLSYREAGEYYAVPYVVKRIGDRWHYTGHIVVGLSD